jgi:hypothetical protein
MMFRPTQIVMEIAGYRDSRNVFHPVGQPLPVDAQPLRMVYEIGTKTPCVDGLLTGGESQDHNGALRACLRK